MRLKPRAILAPLALGLAAWTIPAAAAVAVRQPYLQMLTPTSVYVVQTTDAATDSVVRYGTDPLSLTQTAALA